MPDRSLAVLRRLARPLAVPPGREVRLPDDFDPGHTAGLVKEADAAELLAESVRHLADFQARLAAQSTYGLLVVVQGLDAAGKDGVVKHVLTGVNPAGVRVTGFKVPSTTELRHDYLWRYQLGLPERGGIAVFNRSHYEEVLVVRVHPELLERQMLGQPSTGRDIWERRFRQINDWESYLVDNGIHVVKLFLNISREEQRRRLLARIDDPAKRWKFSMADVQERRRWDDYQRAFAHMLSNTSTRWAPWHVLPADHKWFTRLTAAAVILEALRSIDPRYPTLGPDQLAELEQARRELEAEGSAGR